MPRLLSRRGIFIEKKFDKKKLVLGIRIAWHQKTAPCHTTMARRFVKKKIVGKNTMHEKKSTMPHYHKESAWQALFFHLARIFQGGLP